MEGVRFYAEMQDERRSKSGSKRWAPFTREMLRRGAEEGHRCNVVAVLVCNGRGPSGDFEAISSVMGIDNSPVCSSAVDDEYLRRGCVRISETLARRLHPLLFATLDRTD